MTSEAKESNLPSSLTNWLDAYGRYLEYGAIGVGIAGLMLLGRSIRVGPQFSEAKRIPKEFYAKNCTLYGKVRKVCASGGLAVDSPDRHVILVHHNPIMSIINRPAQFFKSFPSQPSLVRVQIPGLYIGHDTMAQVDKALMNKGIRFTLMKYDDSYETAVSMAHVKNRFLYENLGAWCIRSRFGSRDPIEDKTLLKMAKFSKYCKEMAREEKKLNKTQSRIWRRVLQMFQRKR